MEFLSLVWLCIKVLAALAIAYVAIMVVLGCFALLASVVVAMFGED